MRLASSFAPTAPPAAEARVLTLPGRLGAQPLELDHVRRERVGGVPIAGERPFGEGDEGDGDAAHLVLALLQLLVLIFADVVVAFIW